MGETHVWKTQGGAVPSITDIYSLEPTQQNPQPSRTCHLRHVPVYWMSRAYGVILVHRIFSLCCFSTNTTDKNYIGEDNLIINMTILLFYSFTKKTAKLAHYLYIYIFLNCYIISHKCILCREKQQRPLLDHKQYHRLSHNPWTYVCSMTTL